MTTALITWISVVAFVSFLMIFRSVHSFKRHSSKKYIHLLEITNEREMLFIPGDTLKYDDRDYDSDDDN